MDSVGLLWHRGGYGGYLVLCGLLRPSYHELFAGPGRASAQASGPMSSVQYMGCLGRALQASVVRYSGAIALVRKTRYSAGARLQLLVCNMPYTLRQLYQLIQL